MASPAWLAPALTTAPVTGPFCSVTATRGPGVFTAVCPPLAAVTNAALHTCACVDGVCGCVFSPSPSCHCSRGGSCASRGHCSLSPRPCLSHPRPAGRGPGPRARQRALAPPPSCLWGAAALEARVSGRWAHTCAGVDATPLRAGPTKTPLHWGLPGGQPPWGGHWGAGRLVPPPRGQRVGVQAALGPPSVAAAPAQAAAAIGPAAGSLDQRSGVTFCPPPSPQLLGLQLGSRPPELTQHMAPAPCPQRRFLRPDRPSPAPSCPAPVMPGPGPELASVLAAWARVHSGPGWCWQELGSGEGPAVGTGASPAEGGGLGGGGRARQARGAAAGQAGAAGRLRPLAPAARGCPPAWPCPQGSHDGAGSGLRPSRESPHRPQDPPPS